MIRHTDDTWTRPTPKTAVTGLLAKACADMVSSTIRSRKPCRLGHCCRVEHSDHGDNIMNTQRSIASYWMIRIGQAMITLAIAIGLSGMTGAPIKVPSRSRRHRASCLDRKKGSSIPMGSRSTMSAWA